jgi:Flp pilus assembly protein TadG
MAILAPVLAMLLIGVVNWGSVFFVQHHMVQATREGARVLARPGVEPERAKLQMQDYLTKYYPALMERNAFTVTATRNEQDNAVLTVSVSLNFSDAGVLGGILLPSKKMHSSLTMRGE